MKLLFLFFSLFFFSTLHAADDQAARKELKKGNKIILNGEQYYFSDNVYLEPPSYSTKQSAERNTFSSSLVVKSNTDSNSNKTKRQKPLLLNTRNNSLGVLSGEIHIYYSSEQDLGTVLKKYPITLKKKYPSIKLAIFQTKSLSMLELASLQAQFNQDLSIQSNTIEVVENLLGVL